MLFLIPPYIRIARFASGDVKLVYEEGANFLSILTRVSKTDL